MIKITTILSHQSHQATLRRLSINSLVAALAMVVIPSVQAALIGAPEFTANQKVTVNGNYLPYSPPGSPCCPNPQPIDHTDYSRTNLGESEHDFSDVDGITKGVASWSNKLDNLGFIRSKSELQIQHDFGNWDSFTDLNVEVSNHVSYSDFITKSDIGGPGHFLRFETRLTGNLSNNVEYNNPANADGASKATYGSTVEFSSTIMSSNGQGNNTPPELASTNSILSSPGFFGSNVNETDNLIADIYFAEQVYSFGFFFGFEYTDTFTVDIENIDAGSIDISMLNDLGSTVVTTASWYDINGQLVPDQRAVSSFGFVYAPNPGTLTGPNPNPVPVPATLALFGLGLAGLGWSRRKKV